MESASIPFRSKKPVLHTTPKKPAKQLPAVDGVMLETPEKVNRIRNRNVALSCKDVRQKILSLQRQELDRSSLDSSADGSGRGFGGKEGSLPGLALRSGSGGGRRKKLKASIELPEKFEMLCKFFSSLVGVIRLVRLRKMSPTFTNIRSRVGSFMGRTFTISHLAQLKYIMPEAILVKKIRTLDELTECRGEDLQITLDCDSFDKDWSSIFRSRVEDHLKSHSEEDVPEAELPSLFFQSKQERKHTGVDKCSVPVLPASHFSHRFQTSISRRTSSLRKVEDVSSFHLIPSSVAKIPLASAEENKESVSSAGLEVEPRTTLAQIPATSSLLMSPATKTICTAIGDEHKASGNIHATPLKDASTPARLMASTPPLAKGSKRPMMSSDYDKSETPTKLIRRAQRSRSLKFDFQEKEVAPTEKKQDVSSVNSNLADVLPVDLLQSLKEKEIERIEAQDPAISQAKRRRLLMGGLINLFDLIRLLFLSINRTVIPKQEFLDRTVTKQYDKREVEEQLNILMELVPEFIFETKDSRGDNLIRLNKSADAHGVRKQLLNAE